MDRQCSSCGGFCKKSGCERENAPPEKEWVGLTAYEIQELHLANSHWGNFACAIGAKLKDKNT